jgi:glycosyltransferase involved in cell wall biosynthesis
LQHENTALSSAPARSAEAGKILLFIPMYNCARQIPRVLAQLTPDVTSLLSEVIVVDNRSRDDGTAAAKAALAGEWPIPVRILQNDKNYGLGGSHKVAFNYAIANGFDYCIVLHGDDQGSIADLVPHIRAGIHKACDCLLGARFMQGSTLQGYSFLRTFGNRLFNGLYSLAAGRVIYDLGSGLNMYAVKALRSRRYLKHGNDLTFNYYMILDSISSGASIRFFPIVWREDDQVSNVKLVRQAARVLRIALSFAFMRGRFLDKDHSGDPTNAYPATMIFETGPAGSS